MAATRILCILISHCLLAAAVRAQVDPGPVDPAPAEPPPAPGEVVEDEPIDVPALARRLRSPSLVGAERRRVVQGLLAAGDHGARQLSGIVRADLKRRYRAWQMDRASFLRDFGRRAPRALRARQGRGGAKRVEELRDAALARSRQRGLDKATIRTEIDPRLLELESLCAITVADVLAAVEELREKEAELRIELAGLLVRFHEVERAEELLLRSEEGERYLRNKPLAPDPRGEGVALDRELARLAFYATPMSDQDREALEHNAALAADPEAGLDPGELEGVRELNRIRLMLGIGVLRIDPKLCEACRGHSEDMVRLGFFSHTSPVEGKRSFGQRAALAGTSASAENIAAGQRRGEGAIRAWWYSPGHHRNMLGGHRRVGLGRCETHWTQLFG